MQALAPTPLLKQPESGIAINAIETSRGQNPESWLSQPTLHECFIRDGSEEEPGRLKSHSRPKPSVAGKPGFV